MLALVVAILLRRPRVLVLVAVAAAAADLSAAAIKAATGVERPAFRNALPRPLMHVPHDGSFPSGHAATSFACATVLASFAPRASPLFYLLAVAISFSRIYVGAHWTFDVMGGYAVGALAASAVWWVTCRIVRTVPDRSASP